MRHPSLLAAAAIFSMISCASVQASERLAAPTTPWQGGVVSHGDGGASSYCAIESRFDNGLTLSVAENSGGDLTLVLLVRGLNVRAGAEWPVRVQLGNTYRTINATVMEVSPGGAVIAMPYGTAAVDGPKMAAAKTISFITKTDRANFALSGLDDALPALASCTTSVR